MRLLNIDKIIRINNAEEFSKMLNLDKEIHDGDLLCVGHNDDNSFNAFILTNIIPTEHHTNIEKKKIDLEYSTDTINYDEISELLSEAFEEESERIKNIK